MRIGFFGNTNNYPFMLARAVRALGHDVVFIVDFDDPLYRPEYAHPELSSGYPDWIVDLSPFRFSQFVLPNPRRRRALRILNSCDAVIMNGRGMSLLPHVSKPAIALCTGSDVEYYANTQSLLSSVFSPVRRPRWLWKFFGPPAMRALLRRFVELQRRGIQSAVAVNYFPKGAVAKGDQVLADLGVTGAQRILFMMTDVTHLPLAAAPQNDPLRVFCGTRLNWKRPIPAHYSETDYKGSDVMIRGLGMFRRQTGVRLDVRIVKKGLHVAETIELAAAEGVGDQIAWLDEMSQARIREEIRDADIVIDQFGSTRIFTMMSMDSMAIGRPVIADVDPALFEGYYEGPFPICRAASPEEVCSQLMRLRDIQERTRLAVISRHFVENYFSPERAARMCVRTIERALSAR